MNLRKIGYHDHNKISGIDNHGMNKLTDMYSNVIKERKLSDLKRENEFRIDSHLLHIEAAKKKLAEEMEKNADEINSQLPVSSVFDALQIVKAKKNIKKDAGLRALSGYLNNIWKKDRSANLSANSFLNLKGHYSKNYPKSGMSEVFDEIAKKGYFTLPMADLVHIASTINSQEDYDFQIMKHGLNGNNPNSVKSRKFILAAVNGNERIGYKRGQEDFKLSDDYKDQSIGAGYGPDNVVSSIEYTLAGIIDPGHPLMNAINEYWNVEEDSEERAFIFDEDIHRIMDEIAPDGTYFGGHPGDPADIGFWTYEDDEYYDGEEEDWSVTEGI